MSSSIVWSLHIKYALENAEITNVYKNEKKWTNISKLFELFIKKN